MCRAPPVGEKGPLTAISDCSHINTFTNVPIYVIMKLLAECDILITNYRKTVNVNHNLNSLS